MLETLKKHLEKFILISDEEFLEIAPFFKTITVQKKENLLIEGAICKSHFFVVKGCLRKFFINEKGVEQTTEFAIENWWITDNIAYEHGLASPFYIQAVENSEIISISREAQDKLLEEFPKMERYFRFIYQRAYAASQMRIKYLYEFTKEEFYDQLCEQQPKFVQRIPQYLIASFLGFSPEYLSEIRKKKRS
ncbi:MAG: Crp/Fnr family transcriptional regulator [Bacteroidota bacterium]